MPVKAYIGFTIIELAIVIGIMSILLAIALPTVKSIHLAAERKKATLQATLLTQAVIKYKNVYGFWPGQLDVETTDPLNPTVKLLADFQNNTQTHIIISRFGNTDFQLDNTSSTLVYLDQNYVYRALNTIDPENMDNGLYLPNPLNPRQIEFLDLENANSLQNAGFPDPWGQEFIVFMGLNPRARFTYNYDSGNFHYTLSVSNCTAFAFSRGTGRDVSKKYIMAEGVSYEEY